MKIVSLKDKRKGLTAVLLEDGSELLLDTETVIINGLAPGVFLDDPDALLFESDVKRAKNRALWYLSRGDLSQKKLTEKLIQGGFMPEASMELCFFSDSIDEIINHIENYVHVEGNVGKFRNITQ